ncbi:hypothetical protein BVG16_04225 [Paenibacillus selenitireducens]|jgi:hypothetical protein|uniref:Uncharacterized protein n=1 Tax=Paenibacillus selenitireducens TaxID=1324314 RepID=A0A1T2XJB3_9BACL|nr:hypothetical protein [Paenibacillus selenitireducens]OPA79967.1 hypothetical protein BVG16_04225 [Paenibacillus selenitireducens]
MGQRVKISQNTAIMIERARRFGVTNEVLLQVVATGDLTPLKVAEAEYYSYDEFLSYAEENGEPLEEAIRNGYQITFNTNNGLKVWLFEKFGVEAGRDFTPSEGRVDELTLSSDHIEALKQALAANWVVKDSGETASERKISVVIRALA